MPRSVSQDVLLRLGVLLQLQRRARQAEEQELPFVFVNETRTLVPYRQAVLWLASRDASWRVAAVSGLVVPDPGAPFVLWLDTLGKALRRKENHTDIMRFGAESIPDDLATAWGDWLPEAGIWLPLWGRKKRLAGVLCLFREQSFQDQDVELLSHLAESYGHSLPDLSSTRFLPFPLRLNIQSWRAWLAAALLVLLFFPVRQTVLAPAEVTPRHPAHIRAGLDGVVDSFFVAPNESVRAGQKLLALEDYQLRTRLVVAQKNLEVARAELQQAQHLSFADPRGKMRLPMLQGRAEQLAAEVELVETQLARVTITSPVDGIAVFDDPNIWLGRPVSLGQKILEIANPAEVRLEISLPMSEALPLKHGDSILFFSNISPHAPLAGTLSYIGYQATETPEAGIAFTLRADFAPEEGAPRLGVRGTAKLYGGYMPLVGLLLRRPFLLARQWLGL